MTDVWPVAVFYLMVIVLSVIMGVLFYILMAESRHKEDE